MAETPDQTASASTVDQSAIEKERQHLAEIQERGLFGRLRGYVGLSGPGWLQSAITLGGGSLASSLFLGVLGGYTLLWVQPFAMILGIVMLSTIGYVTLSTSQRPFRAINDHVNPVLGWGWAFAVMAANIVWCLPQYSLAEGVLSQNLLPKVLSSEDGTIVTKAQSSLEGKENIEVNGKTVVNFQYLADNANKIAVSLCIFLFATVITWSYDKGGIGIKIYETILKLIVALIVLCFFGVVIRLSTQGALNWNEIGQGFVPTFNPFQDIAPKFAPMLDKITDPIARGIWEQYILDKQVDVLIAAAATAVGINMTFLFPYSLLRKGWGKEHRGLSIFDLSTGMFIPYVLATSCVVIASASQFHTVVTPDFEYVDTDTGKQLVPPKDFKGGYEKLIAARDAAYTTKLQEEDGADSSTATEPTAVALAEQELAATLLDRKAKHLAQALEPLTGEFFANIIFGFGVLAMTLSTISLLMLISGFVFAEVLGYPAGGKVHRLGTLVAGLGGTLGPFIWSGAAFYLAIPTSVFGLILLPFAYVSFFFLINSKPLLGEERPQGFKRYAGNLLIFTAASIATIASIYMTKQKVGYKGIAVIVGFVLVALMVHVNRKNTQKEDQRA